jgi:DNA gyrase subunit A
VTVKGFGKRTSAYEYRVIGRGGQGVANIEVTPRNGPVVASFPVGEDDQIMLVTNRGQLIRCPVHDIRIARRQTQGVTVFRVGEDEEVVAVAHLSDLGEDEGGNGGEEAPDGGSGGDAPAGDGGK